LTNYALLSSLGSNLLFLVTMGVNSFLSVNEQLSHFLSNFIMALGVFFKFLGFKRDRSIYVTFTFELSFFFVLV